MRGRPARKDAAQAEAMTRHRRRSARQVDHLRDRPSRQAGPRLHPRHLRRQRRPRHRRLRATSRPGLDFFPLTCEYVEKTSPPARSPAASSSARAASASRRSSPAASSIARCRPLFPEGYKKDTQIIATVLSTDKQNPTDVLALTGASAALSHLATSPGPARSSASASAASTASSSPIPTSSSARQSDIDIDRGRAPRTPS